MDIVLGSLNPVKKQATQKAFEALLPNHELNVTAIQTQSGVSEQPLNIEETVQGAINRANQSASSGSFDYGVGIEGGLSVLRNSDGRHYFEQTWAAVLDVETNLCQIASGPAYPMPAHIANMLHDGYNLAQAMEEVYGLKDIATTNGYDGWLSENQYDRVESSKIAVFLALCMHKHAAPKN